MRTHDRIEINPDIMFGKPVIRNIRNIITPSTKKAEPKSREMLSVCYKYAINSSLVKPDCLIMDRRVPLGIIFSLV